MDGVSSTIVAHQAGFFGDRAVLFVLQISAGGIKELILGQIWLFIGIHDIFLLIFGLLMLHRYLLVLPDKVAAVFLVQIHIGVVLVDIAVLAMLDLLHD